MMTARTNHRPLQQRRIRVVQMICGLLVGDFGGGAELFAIRLAQALDARFFEVHICNIWRYNLPVERHWEQLLGDAGVRVHYGAPSVGNIYRDMSAAYLACLPQIVGLRPDIINTHVEYADAVGLALKLSGVSGHLVRTGHTLHEWPTNPKMRGRSHWLYPWVCAGEVGVSRAIVAQLDARPSAKLARTQARYIHNGVDQETVLRQRTGGNIRAALGIAPHVPLFGTVGRLVEQKGIPYLIRAMAHVRTTLPDARLLIVGKGFDEPALRALIAELGLDHCVTLLGGRNDAVDIIARLDVFALASLWEGLPTVVLEAMVLGTPVVATAIPGTRDLIIDGQTGLLVPTRDPQALAAALVRQYRDHAAAQRMVAAARLHATQFSIRVAAEKYRALYFELTRNEAGAGGRASLNDG